VGRPPWPARVERRHGRRLGSSSSLPRKFLRGGRPARKGDSSAQPANDGHFDNASSARGASSRDRWRRSSPQSGGRHRPGAVYGSTSPSAPLVNREMPASPRRATWRGRDTRRMKAGSGRPRMKREIDQRARRPALRVLGPATRSVSSTMTARVRCGASSAGRERGGSCTGRGAAARRCGGAIRQRVQRRSGGADDAPMSLSRISPATGGASVRSSPAWCANACRRHDVLARRPSDWEMLSRAASPKPMASPIMSTEMSRPSRRPPKRGRPAREADHDFAVGLRALVPEAEDADILAVPTGRRHVCLAERSSPFISQRVHSRALRAFIL